MRSPKVVLGSFWNRSGIVLGSFWARSEISRCVFMAHSGNRWELLVLSRTSESMELLGAYGMETSGGPRRSGSLWDALGTSGYL